VARKLPQLQRELGGRSLFSVAYGEIASSIYFALGVVALHAVGFTPLVLVITGGLFLLVTLSYAEATSALPETGGAATFVRHATNDLAGFMTGWALFLDYLIVIALSAIFLPHYLGSALGVAALNRSPGDTIVAVGAIVLVGAVRLVRRPSFYAFGIIIPLLDIVTQLVLVGFGFALLFSSHALMRGTSLGHSPTLHSLAFALPLGMLAYTGLETVANLSQEARRPGLDVPRSLILAVGTVVTMYAAIALVALSAFPGPHTALGTQWLHAPLVGVADQIKAKVASPLGALIRFFVSASGALILLASIITSISGFSRLAYSLGEHSQLPRAFGRLHRRTLVSPEAILSVTAISSLIVVGASFIKDDVEALASVFSFGVLLAFTATQVAVIKLRISEPELERPYRAPFNVTFRGVKVPLPAIVGSILTFAVWIVAIVTHPGARYGGPAWLVLGLIVYVAVRRSHGQRLTERVAAPDAKSFADVPQFSRILVPMKLGLIGSEMAATAIKLAAEHHAAVEALHVIRVPLDQSIDAPLEAAQARAEASLEAARLLGDDSGVEVVVALARARAIGRAIVDHAENTGSDLIVLGSSPRWRRQSRFFSPTVDFVLRHAHCEVLIIAFPQSVLDEELVAP
jgi:APA family basic amino acid/polyamine antiporter